MINIVIIDMARLYRKNGKIDKAFMPLILTQLRKTAKRKQIFNITKIGYMKILVEIQRK